MPHRYPILAPFLAFAIGLALPKFSPIPAQAQTSPDTPCEAPVETPEDPEAESPTPETPQQSQETANIRLSELLPDPAGDDTAGEFLEIFNAGTGDTDLAGWTLKNAAGKTFALPGLLSAGSYRSFTYTESKLALANAGSTVSLHDAAGIEVDAVTYGQSKVGISYAKNDDGSWSWTSTPTPGGPNQRTEPPQPTSTTTQPTTTAPPATDTPATQPPPPAPLTLRILRFLPDPVGSDDAEWIEIENMSDAAAALDGWRVDDEEGGSSPYRIPATAIASHGTLRIERAASKIALNNDGDTVRLLAPDLTIKDSVTYDDAPEGATYERTAAGWTWSGGATTPEPPAPETTTEASTAASEDSAPAPQEEGSPAEEPEEAVQTPSNGLEVLLTELPGMEIGTEIAVEGIVSLPLGTAGKRIFAMQDADGSGGSFVQIYGATAPTLRAGDRIRLIGTLRARADRPYIATTAAKMTIDGSTSVGPRAIAVEEIAAIADGISLMVRGTLAKRTSTTATLVGADLEKELVVKIPKDSLKDAEPGVTIDAAGILRRTTLGFELLSATPRPVAIITPPEPPSDLPTSPTSPLPDLATSVDSPKEPSLMQTPVAQKGFSWAALAAAGSTIAAVVFGKKRPPLV